MTNPFDKLKDDIIGGIKGEISQHVNEGVASIMDDVLGGGGEGGADDGTTGKGL